MEQGKGTSLKRQLESARDFIKRHSDWDYPFTDPLAQQERDFTDQGKSAYAGVHREAGGALYELERKATAGHFRNGAALVVENLDRLTRQGWEEALKVLTTLTTNGMSVHTVHGGKKFNAFEKPDMGQVITVIVEAEADHRASDDKSKRVRKAWDAKIEAMQNGDKKALQDEDEEVRYAARSKVSHALRNIIGSMHCYPDKRVYVHTDLFSIRINADGSHDVLDVIEEAKGHREQLPAQVLAQLQRVEAN